MTWMLYGYLISRMMICAAAGEIAIRYLAWSYVLARSPRALSASPLVVGVAMLSFSRFCIEARFLSLLFDPHRAASFHAIDGNDPVSSIGRIGVILAMSYMTVPVTKIVYRYSWERAVVEMSVRVFLMAVAFGAGWLLATIHLVHGA